MILAIQSWASGLTGLQLPQCLLSTALSASASQQLAILSCLSKNSGGHEIFTLPP